MRRVSVVFIILGMLLVPLAATAQTEDSKRLTSLEPLQEIVDGYAEGDPISGFVQRADDGSPIASSLQFAVNLGLSPAFIDAEIVATGLAPGDRLELVSLGVQFPDSLRSIPPLHPRGTSDGKTDISVLFPDWAIYGEDGRIETAAEVAESPTIVWAIELAEPFDESCAETRSVGRAWMDQGITSAEGLLSPEALEQALGADTHSSLADGENTRLVELRCLEGGTPTVTALRLNADLGRLRPFGPLDVLALVKENHVVFFMTERILGVGEPDIDPFFYANDPGGSIGVHEPSADLPALLPNPYGPDDVHIKIAMDGPGAGTPGLRTVAHDASQHEFFVATEDTVQETCPPDAVDLILLGAVSSLFGGETPWARNQSIPGVVTEIALVNDDIEVEPWGGMGYLFEYPDGEEELIAIDIMNKRVLVLRRDCTGEGSWTLVSGALPGGAQAPPAGSGSDSDGAQTSTPGSDEGGAGSTVPEGGETEPGGIPWGPIGIALAMLGGIAAGVGRSRTRTRDCEPERRAYAAAVRAYEKAKAATEYWHDELRKAEAGLSEARGSQVEFPPPHRTEYPEGPGGDVEFAAATAEYQVGQAADADMTGELMATANAGNAEAKFEEARAAQTTASDAMWAAHRALTDCVKASGGRPGSVPPPPGAQPDPLPPGDSAEPGGCTEGTTRGVPDSTTPPRVFVIADAVSIRIPTGPWAAFAPGGLADPTSLYALTEEAALDLLRDLDNQTPNRVRPNVSIVLKKITVTCERVQRCNSEGGWVETGDKRTVEDVTDAGTVNVPVSTRLDSEGLARFIASDPGTASGALERGEAYERGRLKEALQPYIEAEQEYNGYRCQ